MVGNQTLSMALAKGSGYGDSKDQQHSCDDASTVSISSHGSDGAVYSRASSLNSTRLHPLVDLLSSDWAPSDASAQHEDEVKTSAAESAEPLSVQAFPRAGPLLPLSDDGYREGKETVPRHRSCPSDKTKEIIRLKMELAQAKSEADRQVSLARQLTRANESLKAEIVSRQEENGSLQLTVNDNIDIAAERDELRAENERLRAEMEQILFERNKLKSQLGMMTVEFPAPEAKKDVPDDHRANAMNFLSRMTSTARRLSCERITPLSPEDLLWADDDASIACRSEGPSAA